MQLNLPKYELKIKQEDDKNFVFDNFRKKYVALTPEEYVRQHVALFLVNEKGFPSGLTATEHSLKVYEMERRADIVNYNTAGEIVMITECKAPSVKISQKTFDQIARYNMTFKAKFLLVTNGINHYCCEFLPNAKYKFLHEIPNFKDIQS
ncbi:MAG: restriction endonuclease subunit R [Candidatus Delongbacteria bacterium]|nr:MAG: restriction endonuclease subunit R [Candidatus Delongbacteria bacterium]